MIASKLMQPLGDCDVFTVKARPLRGGSLSRPGATLQVPEGCFLASGGRILIRSNYHIFERLNEMTKTMSLVLYVVALVAVVVSADVLFFRHLFWARLMVNIGIVLVFAAFYLRFLKRP